MLGNRISNYFIIKKRSENMKVLHVFPNANFSVSSSFIRFIRENFNKKKHDFVISSNDMEKRNKNNDNHDVMFLTYKKIFNDKKINQEYNYIFLHSMFSIPYSSKIKLLLSNNFFKKIVWIGWGADLYKQTGTLKSFLRSIFNNMLLKKIKYFVGIFPPDIKYFKEEYNSDASTFYASYTGNLYNSLYKKDVKLKTLRKKNNNNEIINIQIGHSSTKTLNHIEVLETLKKYRDKNIKIFLPLSYGDKEYGDTVQMKAKEIFGNKATTIREMIPENKYMNFLSNMDIVIFNTSRQIGLGNISPLLFMKKKIYIPKNTVMYDFYQSQKINICNYNDIEDYTFNEFIQPVEMEAGQEYIINNELNKKKKIQMWSNVFKGIQEEEK